MEEKERKILKALNQEEKEYPCVWYEDIKCPIRTKWKLLPENLAPWCSICQEIGYLKDTRNGKEKE